ncbi:MAG: NAD(P)-binding protein, partial [Bacteroidota bacterium]
MPTATKIIVIGSGFAGLSAACVLAAEGYQVQI